MSAVVCPVPAWGGWHRSGRLLGPEIPIGLGDELLKAAGAAEHLRGPGMLDAVRRILGHHHATDRIAHRPILVRAARAVRAVWKTKPRGGVSPSSSRSHASSAWSRKTAARPMSSGGSKDNILKIKNNEADLGTVQNAARGLLRLLNDILDLSKVETLILFMQFAQVSAQRRARHVFHDQVRLVLV